MHPEWITPEWPAPANVRALVTTRIGGVSEGPFASLNLGAGVNDNVQAVAENRARLRANLPADPVWLAQVHGTHVVCADQCAPGVMGDASWSHRESTVCIVMIADCLPILLCDTDGTTVAAVHAGWRGLSAGVVEQTVHAMQCPASRLVAWLGPAIGPDHFEVGDEVRAAFLSAAPEAEAAFRPGRSGKWMANLYQLATQRLRKLGVTEISGGGTCTYHDARRFFSHRRDSVCGRMAAAIWLQHK